jgi:hypothetical protein
MMMRERRRLHANSLLEPVGAEVGAPWPGGDRHTNRIRFGGDAHRVRAVEHERSQVAGIEIVSPHALLLRLVELVLVERNLHRENLRRPEQAVGVVAQAEDRGAVRRLVAADAFEHTHAVMQRMRQDVRRRIAPRHHLAVEPDPSVTIGHRHSGHSCTGKNAILAESHGPALRTLPSARTRRCAKHRSP